MYFPSNADTEIAVDFNEFLVIGAHQLRINLIRVLDHESLTVQVIPAIWVTIPFSFDSLW